jgi:hypothetical protein
MREIRQISMNVAEAKRARMSPCIVFLREPRMGIPLAFSDREKQKRAKGIAAPAVPIRPSRRRCSVRGNNTIFHIRAKTSAMMKAIPSTRRARPKSFDLRVIEKDYPAGTPQR